MQFVDGGTEIKTNLGSRVCVIRLLEFHVHRRIKGNTNPGRKTLFFINLFAHKFLINALVAETQVNKVRGQKN